MPRSRLAFASLFALSLALVPATGALAQSRVAGSGLAPGEVANSAERPLEFAASAPADAALVLVLGSATLPDSVQLSAAERTGVEAAIASAKFKGNAGETLALRGIGSRPRLLLLGVGETPTGLDFQTAGGKAAQDFKSEAAPVAIAGLTDAESAAEVALGFRLGGYRFDRYQSGTADSPPPVQPVTLALANHAAARAAFDSRQAGVAEGVRFARDLVNEPANVIYPESFVERTRAAFRGVRGVEIEVLDEVAMRRLGMGAILGVGQGSPRPPRLLLVTYRGVDGPPLALVGKGITFDTGGISLKTSAGMADMKGDMSGAAAVVGTVLSLAKTRAPVNVVAVAALAENMPDGNAQRPSDVVRTMSGKTIEVINTDAEGRLVLSDALEYVAKERKPFAIVDLATLTGAAVSALGPEYAGLFARDDSVAERIEQVAKRVGEGVWRLPLHPDYARAVKSDIADVKNSGNSPAPGASAGAHFVEAFVAEDMPWAHIDMAPTMWANSTGPLTPKGPTAYGVRLLDALAREWKPAQ